MNDWQAEMIAQFRPRIDAELAELRAASQASLDERSPVQLDQQSVGRLARMDAMQVQAMAQASERRRQARIASLQAALARIDRGEYGECAECGEPIAEGRLSFDPTVQLCVACVRGGGR